MYLAAFAATEEIFMILPAFRWRICGKTASVTSTKPFTLTFQVKSQSTSRNEVPVEPGAPATPALLTNISICPA